MRALQWGKCNFLPLELESAWVQIVEHDDWRSFLAVVILGNKDLGEGQHEPGPSCCNRNFKNANEIMRLPPKTQKSVQRGSHLQNQG